MLEQPRYIPHDELTAEQKAERLIASTEAQEAAQSNANLAMNPTTGAMEPVGVVHEELERMQGEQR